VESKKPDGVSRRLLQLMLKIDRPMAAIVWHNAAALAHADELLPRFF